MIATFLQEPGGHDPRRIDYLGSVLMMAAMTALMMVLVQASSLPTATLWHRRRNRQLQRS